MSRSKRCCVFVLVFSLVFILINFIALIWYLTSTDSPTQQLTPLTYLPISNSSFLPDIKSCEQYMERGIILGEKWKEVWFFGQEYGNNGTMEQFNVVDGETFNVLVKDRMIPVRGVINACGDKILVRTEKVKRDINVFLTVTGAADRYRNLETTISYFLNRQIDDPYNLTVRIVVVEISQSPTTRLVKNIGLDYIFFPKNLVNVTGTPDNFFPKSFAYNMGFALAEEATWNIFHDVDIIVPPGFFSIIYTVSKKHEWFLPYTLIDYLSYFETEHFYMRDIRAGKFPWFYETKTRGTARHDFSLGGCVVISSNLFKKVGGYDHEINFGWAPEDWWIIQKLKFYEPMYRAPLTLKHLYHKVVPHRGLYADFSHLLLGHFTNLTNTEKQNYFELKKQILM